MHEMWWRSYQALVSHAVGMYNDVISNTYPKFHLVTFHAHGCR